jgi:hypothetical protein
MRRVCSTNGEKRNACRMLVGKPERDQERTSYLATTSRQTRQASNDMKGDNGKCYCSEREKNVM